MWRIQGIESKESNINNQISVDIPNYSGPLETLLDLAKKQKVDLTQISVTKLADEFSDYIKNFKDKILLIVAFHEDTMVASAINFISKSHLYGRLWGSKYEIPFLHFELCYYQAIEYAISNNIKIVEAGAQGEHKLQRGYAPVKTWSSHWIKDKEFSKAIRNFLDNEGQIINNQKEELEKLTPYKLS